MFKDVFLSEIPGSSDSTRLALYLRNTMQGSQLMLCSQTWAEGIGWFTQSSVAIEPSQVANLRQAISPGLVSGDTKVRRQETHRPTLRIVG